MTNHTTHIYSSKQGQEIPIPTDANALMNEASAAAYLDLTPRCMQNFRLTGRGPRFIKIGKRCVRYRRRELDLYAESLLVSSTSEEGNACV